MIEQLAQDVYYDISDAIIHDAYIGFKEDYLCLHSLIRKYRPNSFYEIGSNIGSGVNVIANAIYKYNPQAKIYSLDLPYETMRENSKQYPIGENGEDRVGSAARFPYTQLRGDSLTFDFSQYPCEGYFVDGEHDYEHPYTEITKVLLLKPKIVIAHDSDIPDVWRAINDAIFENGFPYELYRVTDTRIAYALRK